MSGSKRWTRKRIADSLAKRERPPTRAELEHADEDTPSYGTIRREFGSLDNALVEAGYPAGTAQRGRSKEKA